MVPVAARGLGRSNAVARRGARIALLILLCVASFSAAALEDPSPSVSAPPTSSGPEPRAAAQMEITATSLPRFDNLDGTARSSRLDMVWLPARRSGLGLALGITNIAGPGLPSMEQAPGPGLDLGFHWRYPLDRQYRIDVTAWRRMTPSDALDLEQAQRSTYGARVEMRLGSMPKSGFVADRGFLGLQLESGARITVRRKAGRPMFYYRTRF
jgi:hypothetical protein